MNSSNVLPISRQVVASYKKADQYLTEAQRVVNIEIKRYYASDLSNDYNADRLAAARAELAGIRKLQAMTILLRG